jgi:rod shape determining protein RodA
MASSRNNTLAKGIDWTVVWLYGALVAVGVLCIFMVEYQTGDSLAGTIFKGKTNYSKQILFAAFCAVVGMFIVLTDSKLFTALANLSYVTGILLMLATFVIGKNINGSKSWIPLGGGFNLQPAELCKIFAALALAKYLSQPETIFKKIRSQLLAAAIVLLPAVLSILQHELGLALVYTAFLIPMYREGMPAQILVIAISFGVLVIASLIIEPNLLAGLLTLIAMFILYALRKAIRRNKRIITLVIARS